MSNLMLALVIVGIVALGVLTGIVSYERDRWITAGNYKWSKRKRKPFVHKPLIGTCALEWQVGDLVMQFHHNDVFNWREYGTIWRFSFWLCRPWKKPWRTTPDPADVFDDLSPKEEIWVALQLMEDTCDRHGLFLCPTCFPVD